MEQGNPIHRELPWFWPPPLAKIGANGRRFEFPWRPFPPKMVSVRLGGAANMVGMHPTLVLSGIRTPAKNKHIFCLVQNKGAPKTEKTKNEKKRSD